MISRSASREAARAASFREIFSPLPPRSTRRKRERSPPMASVSSPSPTMARAASFSSRMFPGQLYSRKKFWVSGLSTGTAREKSRAAAERNQSRRTGISSFRWRKGGSRKQTPLIDVKGLGRAAGERVNARRYRCLAGTVLGHHQHGNIILRQLADHGFDGAHPSADALDPDTRASVLRCSGGCQAFGSVDFHHYPASLGAIWRPKNPTRNASHKG